MDTTTTSTVTASALAEEETAFAEKQERSRCSLRIRMPEVERGGALRSGSGGNQFLGEVWVNERD
jgi:hypothetical protein